ncbi:MAG: RNA methyltransferase [Leptospiraceae bacterium]|nr:RNA methyltransferase [Leptospiraceae bacterium]MCP5512081.1 RNA methyltransferase [Leptospiraceae bacterium]
MNLILLEENERIDTQFYRLNFRKSDHIKNILKSKPGDILEAGVLNLTYGNIEIVEINNEITCRFIKNSKSQRSTFRNLTVFSSLQRPQTIKKLLFLCGMYGIRKIVFYPLQKNEKSYLNSSIWEEEEIHKHFLLGMEQGKNIYLPELKLLKSFKKSLDDYKKINFFLNPESEHFLDPRHRFSESTEFSIILGPEPGYTNSELDFFKNLNTEEIKISNFILRSEHALQQILSQIEFLNR